MAVSASVTLPAQPSGNGTVSIHPLGGDGYTAPQSSYTVSVLEVAGAAGGGAATLTINLDPQYESLVSVIQGQIVGIAAATAMKFRLRQEGGMSVFTQGIAPVDPEGTTARFNWTPGPLLRADVIEMIADNTDGDTYRLSAVIFNFRKLASQTTPLPILLASLPRGGSVV